MPGTAEQSECEGGGGGLKLGKRKKNGNLVFTIYSVYCVISHRICAQNSMLSNICKLYAVSPFFNKEILLLILLALSINLLVTLPWQQCHLI